MNEAYLFLLVFGLGFYAGAWAQMKWPGES